MISKFGDCEPLPWGCGLIRGNEDASPSLYGYDGAVWMAFGSAPVGVADNHRVSLKTKARRYTSDLRPGKPTTDSGGKSSELTSAIQSNHQHSALCASPIKLTASGRIHIRTACTSISCCRNCGRWYSSSPCKEGKQCAFAGGVGRNTHLQNRTSPGFQRSIPRKTSSDKPRCPAI